jgi:ribonucleoside-diphosphate reductase alpha chain
MQDKFNHLAEIIFKNKYALTPDETWAGCCYRVITNVMSVKGYDSKHPIVQELIILMLDRKFIPAGRYLYATGRKMHQTSNCVCLGVDDSREGWADLLSKAAMSLMTGAGIGVEYSKIRPKGSMINKTGGTASGPIALMKMINESARYIHQGGSRRSAVWAGLNWRHQDIGEFLKVKNWDADIKRLKGKDFNFPAPLDMTNISVGLDDEFFTDYSENGPHSHMIYQQLVRQMCETGEPGLSVNIGGNYDWIYRNACTEFTSNKPYNICNLGSINMARIKDFAEFTKVVELATLFLYCGTRYTLLPFAGLRAVLDTEPQIGLGLTGMHEWFIQRGLKYGEINETLKKWMSVYESNLELLASHLVPQDPRPIKGRAIAPAGTIGILAETTTGIEPIFCTAYKRRYLKGDTWFFQYVVDPTAKRLIEAGVPEESIEDAFSLSKDVERRIAFQAWLQSFVDMGISSTINLPQWGSEVNNENTVDSFGKILMKYLPQLRGITCYPDGARSGQPFTPVKLSTALKKAGEELTEEYVDVCSLTNRGSCGT